MKKLTKKQIKKLAYIGLIVTANKFLNVDEQMDIAVKVTKYKKKLLMEALEKKFKLKRR